MGAMAFNEIAFGTTAKQAFDSAVAAAMRQLNADLDSYGDENDGACGELGSSGTIAEKDDFVIVAPGSMTEADAERLASRLLDDHEAISDKWGPAGAIALTPDSRGNGRWMFFGWANE